MAPNRRPSLLANPRVQIALIVGLLVIIGVAGYPAAGYLYASWEWKRAQSAIKSRDFKKAQKHLAACIREWPDSAETVFVAARTARRCGDFETAERLLAEAKRLQWVPQQIEVDDALIQVQYGNHKPVIGFLQVCLRKDHPDSLEILEILTPYARRIFDMPLAQECLEHRVRIEPESAQARLERGDLREILLRKTDALEDFQLAVQLDPNLVEARHRLGKLELEMNLLKDARAQYEWLAQRQPNDPRVRLGLARCCYGEGLKEEAAEILDKLLLDEPKNGEAIYVRGQIELDSGRPAAAEPYFRKTVELLPGEIDRLFNLEKSLDAQGRSDEAETVRKRRQASEEDQKTTLQLMKKIWKDPTDAEARRHVGELMFRNGLEGEAKRWLELAIRTNPAHAPTYETLALYYEKLGDLRSAKDCRDTAKALAAKPENPPKPVAAPTPPQPR